MLAVVAGLALAPRFLVSRDIEPGQPQWIERARKFQAAVARGDWAATFMAPHPGLTVLWIAGYAELFAQSPTRVARGEAASRGVGVATTVVLVAALLVLERLLRRSGHPAPRAAALTTGLILALDPILILTSGLIGLDGLLAMLMLLSALLLVLHGFTRSRSSLAGALVSGGLAAATKVAGLILILAPPLTRIGPAGESGRPSWRRVLALAVAWAAAAVLVVALLLPLAWVRPNRAADLLLLGGSHHRESLATVVAKPRAVYMLGDSSVQNGPQYYLVNLAFRSTPLAVAGLLLGLAFSRYRSDRVVRQLAAILLLVLIVITIARQKEWRYMVPLVPLLDVLGALGLVEAARRLASAARRPLLVGLLPAALALGQGVWTASAHPFYELRLNPLFGGAHVGSHAIKLGWTGGYRQTIAFLKGESKRLHRPVTWSGGAVKWTYFQPNRKASGPVRWIGRSPANDDADCHVYDSLTDVAGLSRADKRWLHRGVVSYRLAPLGIEVVRIRCLESRGFLSVAAPLP